MLITLLLIILKKYNNVAGRSLCQEWNPRWNHREQSLLLSQTLSVEDENATGILGACKVKTPAQPSLEWIMCKESPCRQVPWCLFIHCLCSQHPGSCATTELGCLCVLDILSNLCISFMMDEEIAECSSDFERMHSYLFTLFSLHAEEI